MSNSALCELDDDLWKKFGDCSDYMVPFASSNHLSRFINQVACHKKPHCDVEDPFVQCTDIIVCSNNGLVEATGATVSASKQECTHMLDRNSWCLKPDNGDAECVDGDAALPLNSVNQSDNGYKIGYSESVQNEFSADDNGLSHLRLPDISTPDNEFKLFPKREEGREYTDLLDYGWPEIGNFENIDHMFWNCDSQFGQSDTTAEATSWFCPLMNANDSRENGGKLEEKAKNMSVTCNVHGESTFNNEYNNKYACGTLNYWLLDVNESSNMGVLFCSNWFDSESEEKEEYEPSKQENTAKDGNKTKLSPLLPVDNGNDMPRHHFKQKVNQQIELPSSQTQSMMREGCLEFLNDSRAPDLAQGKEAEKLKLLAAPSESIPSSHTQIWESAATCDLNPHDSCNTYTLHFPVAQNTFTCTPKAKINLSSMILNKAEKTNGFNSGQYTFSDFDAEEADVNPDFSIGQGSCTSSVLSNSVTEAISFRELQDVMEQLDPRTKLCIRDSLYRLASSAEQRRNLHNGNHKSNNGVDIVEGPSAEESNKSDGVVVAETNTNPIDRSMVHLLFYRPPNTLPSSTIGEMSRDSRSPINGTSMTQPVMLDQINGATDAKY